jgi:hypothetical protein
MPYPENRKKIQGIFAPVSQTNEILPKIRKFAQKLRKGTGKEQESSENRT